MWLRLKHVRLKIGIGYGKMVKTIIELIRVCRKYRIPFKDLPEVLEEYIYEDNIGWSD